MPHPTSSVCPHKAYNGAQYAHNRIRTPFSQKP
ncbi:hypothetical protein H206_05188 [Candidatus Electrothrix aarhusensis]|uniref:Uncharacterized protein n=1 Tax=Candidatus Electrothrix aarhusensis TaxID=1859131 RepID=A0A3S3UEB1_9BACT|nr:hypothetical protein H206_05188 [Candidatus Electrothrix aarhusensis]